MAESIEENLTQINLSLPSLRGAPRRALAFHAR
jgi:hypothetical protein